MSLLPLEDVQAIYKAAKNCREAIGDPVQHALQLTDLAILREGLSVFSLSRQYIEALPTDNPERDCDFLTLAIDRLRLELFHPGEPEATPFSVQGEVVVKAARKALDWINYREALIKWQNTMLNLHREWIGEKFSISYTGFKMARVDNAIFANVAICRKWGEIRGFPRESLAVLTSACNSFDFTCEAKETLSLIQTDAELESIAAPRLQDKGGEPNWSKPMTKKEMRAKLGMTERAFDSWFGGYGPAFEKGNRQRWRVDLNTIPKSDAEKLADE